MDYKKIAADFEKSYEKECESMYFCGKPLIFFSRTGTKIGCGVSVGGCAAVLPRADGRINVRISHSNELISFNVSELGQRGGGELTEVLIHAAACGVEIGGADILIHFNSRLECSVGSILLASLGGFCKGAPPAREIIKHFEGYGENLMCMYSRKDRLTAWQRGEIEYFPLTDAEFKIVLCALDERVMLKKDESGGRADDAKAALKVGDTEKFGALLSEEASGLLKNCRAKRTRRLFETAEKLGDALGSGILSDGGIFSIVRNDKVDIFMHNLGREYEKHLGKRPDFYVTRAEDSGIRVPPR